MAAASADGNVWLVELNPKKRGSRGRDLVSNWRRSFRGLVSLPVGVR